MSLWLAGGQVVDPWRGTAEVRDLHVDDQGRIADSPTPGARRVDCAGLAVLPALCELHAALPSLHRDAHAAVRGGFARVVGRPIPSRGPATRESVRALVEEISAAPTPCHVHLLGALTMELGGEDLSEIGFLSQYRDTGVIVGVSDGGAAVGHVQVLRRALEYASGFDLLVFLRAAERTLEEGGVMREGSCSVRLGLPGVPPESEEIGIHRVATLARRTGARVHLTHLWSARGVEALRRVKSEIPSLTASTTVHHLALEDTLVEELQYDGRARFHPPLGNAADRAALLEAVRDGTIDAVAVDDQPLPPHAKQQPFEDAVPGAAGFEVALSLAIGALDGDLLAVARALASGPRRVLGRGEEGLVPGGEAQLVLVDPSATWVTGSEERAPRRGASPVDGRPLRGRVQGTVVGSRWFDFGAGGSAPA